MSKIMPWIDELPEAAKTDFPARRDEIGALLDEARALCADVLAAAPAHAAAIKRMV